jgi:hypothetical protein
MRIYITCSRRKGCPKIAVEVCRHTCRRRKKCRTLYQYRNPPLFPELYQEAGHSRA